MWCRPHITERAERAERAEQIADWQRVVDTSELLMLAHPEGVDLHIYSTHPRGGYRIVRITPDDDGGLPDVGQARAPETLSGWLLADWEAGYREYTTTAQ